ncbi:alpha-xylosidase 1-like [Nymphaea colorata]|nr:alpha-xylosidase 1-like [Nymphaea colorata]
MATLSPLIVLFCSLLLSLSPFEVSAHSHTTKIGKGYRLVSLEESPDGGLIGLLRVKKKTHIYGPDIPHLQLYVKHETDDRLRVHITDAERQRWEVPYNLLPRAPAPLPLSSGRSLIDMRGRKDFEITPSEHGENELIFGFNADPFGFYVRRRSNGETLFNSTADKRSHYGQMVFKDQYLEISTSLPENSALYGLGENTQPKGIRIQPHDKYTLYTTDISAINLNTDLYGDHPYYVELRNNGGKASFHGVLLMNSNAMDVFYRGTSLTYKVIGGVLDFYFFAGPTPLGLMDQYTSFVGRPAPMPYWALGFHQCRWGYHNVSEVASVVEGYSKARIPLDVMWTDDDHMDAAKDFTLSALNFPPQKMKAFLKKLHGEGRKYIVLIDPGINVNRTYKTYLRGMADDVFIKLDGEPYLAQVWPGMVYFPDFLNPKTVDWWSNEISTFRKLVPVDGLWIDMNEPSNFCSGKCTVPTTHPCPNPEGHPWDCCLDCTNLTQSKWDNPPYKINASGMGAPLGFKTIATSATHYNGVPEYDAHSLYGFSQAIATHKALLKSTGGKRPFVLTRSTFVGSGKYAAHWTGDNKGDWDNLRYSISTILNFGLFGMPMVGSDICGFYPAPLPLEQLCNRWIQLGAFYPFSRDHANFASPRQELYQWKSVAESARVALGLRYKLLPYLYTLNYEAHTTGAPIARPVFFSFPSFVESYGLSTQFLLGSSVLVSPVLEANVTKVKALFPPGTWYSLFDLSKKIVSKGQYFTLDAPLNVVNAHVYQNTILPMQRGGLISNQTRTTPFTLVIAFPSGAKAGEATGKVFIDDDEDPVMQLRGGKSTFVDFHANVGEGKVKVWSKVDQGQFAVRLGLMIEKVVVLGLAGKSQGLEIEVEGEPLDSPTVSKLSFEESQIEHMKVPEAEVEDGLSVGTMMVQLGGLDLPLGKRFSVSWEVNIGGI